MDKPILVVRNVSKTYSGIPVLDDISIVIEEPEAYVLLGPNGSGKTTLLRIIAGIILPDKGEVLVFGHPSTTIEARRLIGYCPQEPALNDLLTGLENVKLFTSLYGLDFESIKDKVFEYAEMLGLKKDLNKLVGKYSGGMKKKLSFIISIVHEPKLLVLDEPTTGLDPESRKTVWKILEEHKEKSVSILLSTHYPEEAEKLADRVGIMYGGKIMVEGTPAMLKKKYGPPSVVELKLYRGDPKVITTLLMDYGIDLVPGEKSVKLHTDNPEKIVPEVINRIYEVGGGVEYLRIREPGLDDVFVNITGRRIDEE